MTAKPELNRQIQDLEARIRGEQVVRLRAEGAAIYLTETIRRQSEEIVTLKAELERRGQCWWCRVRHWWRRRREKVEEPAAEAGSAGEAPSG